MTPGVRTSAAVLFAEDTQRSDRWPVETTLMSDWDKENMFETLPHQYLHSKRFLLEAGPLPVISLLPLLPGPAPTIMPGIRFSTWQVCNLIDAIIFTL